MKRVSLWITHEGWYYLGMMGFIIAGAIIRDINLLYIMAGMMLGPFLFSFYAASRSLRRLALERRFEPLIAVGEPLYVEIKATKPKGSPRGLALQVHDTIQRNHADRKSRRRAQVFFPVVRPGQENSHTYCVRLYRRGSYRLGPLRASTGIPLGLVRAEALADLQQTVKVSPPLGQLKPAWARTIQRKDDGGQTSIHRRGRAEGDFYGMREWRDGDSRNWIHWRTSAKRMKLTVRQFQQPISQDLVVILDLYLPRESDVNPQDVEGAISFAATLVAEQRKHGSTQMSVASASKESFALHGNSSPVFYREVMERLALVEADDDDRLPELLADVLPRATPNSRIVLISLVPRELEHTDKFRALWGRNEARRSLSDVIRVQAGTPEFGQLFHMGDQQITGQSQGQTGVETEVSAGESAVPKTRIESTSVIDKP